MSRYQIPSRKYITDKIIPDIASDARAKVEGAMHVILVLHQIFRAQLGMEGTRLQTPGPMVC